jgi:hypothetical protein
MTRRQIQSGSKQNQFTSEHILGISPAFADVAEEIPTASQHIRDGVEHIGIATPKCGLSRIKRTLGHPRLQSPPNTFRRVQQNPGCCGTHRCCLNPILISLRTHLLRVNSDGFYRGEICSITKHIRFMAKQIFSAVKQLSGEAHHLHSQQALTGMGRKTYLFCLPTYLPGAEQMFCSATQITNMTSQICCRATSEPDAADHMFSSPKHICSVMPRFRRIAVQIAFTPYRVSSVAD